MLPRCAVPLILRLVSGIIAIAAIPGAEAANSALDQQFAQTVRPFVTRYCIGCHSGETPAAQLDLKAYSTMDTVVRDHPRWALVLDKLTAKQMPPSPLPQPPAEARQQVIDWIKAMRLNEARKNAGDPGQVLARRLSNSEYDYTIRDLTGVDIRPASEFPVDPANTAGFDNSGESLSMSPALLNKYLQAARKVGDNMVLTPDGFAFAPYPMLVETDRDKYAIKRIVDFYERQPTDYADYFQAAWRFKHRSALGKPGATLAAIAAESKVSAKYLPMIWQLLEETPEAAKKEVGPIAKLQGLWRELPTPGGNHPDKDAAVRAQCVQMRDFVVRIRNHTAMQFAAPVVKGLPAGSQPLMNWKYLQFNSHRRDFDPAALRTDTDPVLVVPAIPRYPGLHQEAAPRWAALTAKARADDPDLVVPAAERVRYEASFARFASVFPDTFYVKERGRYFPDDSQDKGRLLSAGYHNVMGYWRDDTPLMELILDDKGQKELNRLWDEFDFIADHTARTWDQYYFNQSGEVDGKGAESGRLRPPDKKVNDPAVIFGLRDDYLAKAKPANNPAAMEAIRVHFQWENDTMRRVERMRLEAEPHHLDALLKFAARAYRRPLAKSEREDILAYYHTLREKDGLSHEEAVRESVVSVLMSPDFCYRIDMLDTSDKSANKGSRPTLPLSGYALASRLSYFLWSSMPDQELLAHAASGDLHRADVLIAQARRMLKDEKVRGLATEFGGNWLDFRRFEQNNSVDRERFPSFNNELREAMFEEPIRLIEDMIHNDRSVLDLLYGNYTFVNLVLSRHYGMPDVPGGQDHWVRVDDAGKYGRGGLLPMAVFLTQNSPGLRTSPVKRGYWVVRRVLGETIPPPPPVVPELPNDESKSDLPLRDMLAKHRANAVCASCHARFDSFGLAFEGYGPVGEARTKDLAGRPVDTKAVFPGGSQGAGFEGVEAYIREHRQTDYLDNLSRKLLAYALNRSLLLSDELTVQQMGARLAANGYRFDSLVETIVTSPQFLNRRILNSRVKQDSP
ncbi:MAG TPA: DUF1592 domain-containing protein, partial [Bryobacteraceae bacterium]|nr:DUF1592 domain-containing protein [Bryobacteraceae bacterium]